MPVDINWYDDNILLVEYSRSLSVDEVNSAREKIIAQLDSARRKTHMIADWRKATNTPLRYSMRPRVLDLLRHRNLGTVAIVGINAVLAFWAELYSKRGGLRYVTANSVEEAAQALRELDKGAPAKR
jgi:hypothetical protein